LEHVARPERLPVVEARRDLPERAPDAEPRLALVPQRRRRRLRPRLGLRRAQLRLQADPAHAQVGDLDVGVLEAARVLALVPLVEVGAELPDPRVVDRAGAAVDAELVALAEVAAVRDPLDEDPVLGHAV